MFHTMFTNTLKPPTLWLTHIFTEKWKSVFLRNTVGKTGQFVRIKCEQRITMWEVHELAHFRKSQQQHHSCPLILFVRDIPVAITSSPPTNYSTRWEDMNGVVAGFSLSLGGLLLWLYTSSQGQYIHYVQKPAISWYWSVSTEDGFMLIVVRLWLQAMGSYGPMYGYLGSLWYVCLLNLFTH